MDSTNGQCSLFICPVQHDLSVDNTALIPVLQDIGFIAEKINPVQAEQRYFSGDNFLKLVSYMGCAPAIQFEASDNEAGDNANNFCFIQIHHHDSVHLIHSKVQSRAPHCPHCHKPVKDWANSLTTTKIFCSACNKTSNIEQFDWRKMAGYARLFIEITDIFPKEAIPQPALLEKLASAFDCQWQYFYSCR